VAANTKKGFAAAVAEGEVKGAGRALLEDLFEDYYKHRKRLYFMNLVRGLFFGFGSVIGGTIHPILKRCYRCRPSFGREPPQISRHTKSTTVLIAAYPLTGAIIKVDL
jgi:hypothetical protein